MQFFRLRESLVHGDADFPLHAYSLISQGGFVFPCHWHPEWEFILVTDGSLMLQSGDDLTRVDAGEVAFMGPAELHAGTSQEPVCSCRAVVFNPSLLDPAVPDAAAAHWLLPLTHGRMKLPGRLGPADPTGPAIIATLTDLIADADSRDAGWELRIRGRLLMLMGLLAGAGYLSPCEQPRDSLLLRHDNRLKKVLGHIEDHLAEPFTLEGLADIACLSRSSFSRFFKARTGETALEFINRSRMQRAVALLRQPGWTVSMAAGAVGFDNLSYFTRTFKRFAGFLPSELKE